jgi:hypothetical protein
MFRCDTSRKHAICIDISEYFARIVGANIEKVLNITESINTSIMGNASRNFILVGLNVVKTTIPGATLTKSIGSVKQAIHGPKR